eukprot:m.792896 g.792896  ORF g.792896 m.792896 type:complete len:104 (+) comp23333_c0_seq2:505-816(+)
MNGRFFGGRVVRAHFYDLQKYVHCPAVSLPIDSTVHMTTAIAHATSDVNGTDTHVSSLFAVDSGAVAPFQASPAQSILCICRCWVGCLTNTVVWCRFLRKEYL